MWNENHRGPFLEVVYKNTVQHVVHSTLFVDILSEMRNLAMHCLMWKIQCHREIRNDASKRSAFFSLQFFVPFCMHLCVFSCGRDKLDVCISFSFSASWHQLTKKLWSYQIMTKAFISPQSKQWRARVKQRKHLETCKHEAILTAGMRKTLTGNIEFKVSKLWNILKWSLRS